MAIQFDNELHNNTIWGSIITENYTIFKTIVNLLENINENIPKRNLVTYTTNVLSPKVDYVASLILYDTPFTLFLETYLIHLLEEQRIN